MSRVNRQRCTKRASTCFVPLATAVLSTRRHIHVGVAPEAVSSLPSTITTEAWLSFVSRPEARDMLGSSHSTGAVRWSAWQDLLSTPGVHLNVLVWEQHTPLATCLRTTVTLAVDAAAPPELACRLIDCDMPVDYLPLPGPVTADVLLCATMDHAEQQFGVHRSASSLDGAPVGVVAVQGIGGWHARQGGGVFLAAMGVDTDRRLQAVAAGCCWASLCRARVVLGDPDRVGLMGPLAAVELAQAISFLPALATPGCLPARTIRTGVDLSSPVAGRTSDFFVVPGQYRCSTDVPLVRAPTAALVVYLESWIPPINNKSCRVLCARASVLWTHAIERGTMTLAVTSALLRLVALGLGAQARDTTLTYDLKRAAFTDVFPEDMLAASPIVPKLAAARRAAATDRVDMVSRIKRVLGANASHRVLVLLGDVALKKPSDDWVGLMEACPGRVQLSSVALDDTVLDQPWTHLVLGDMALVASKRTPLYPLAVNRLLMRWPSLIVCCLQRVPLQRLLWLAPLLHNGLLPLDWQHWTDHYRQLLQKSGSKTTVKELLRKAAQARSQSLLSRPDEAR